MNDLEIEFLEEYKALDILLKDVLSSDSGVTSYINKMSERCLVSKASAKVLQFFHICKFSCKFFRIICVFRPFFLILTIECSYITEKMITFAGKNRKTLKTP